ALRFPRYSLLALVTAAAVFLSPRPVQRLERLIQVLDAVGLGAFTAGGGLLAIQRGFGEPFMVVAFGLLTGVGGGILRDILAGEPPLVFRREIYALASIAGALLLLPLNRRLGVETALYACFALVVSLRLFCILRGIHLPLARKG
ncbi:trimeric intracellular cation channel family protein, partial [Aminomonas paucivorans]|uniref:trimeric intracellular cation channel family protein n=1 Tax=Aminomonas paucivorans TaxID=81412 RepID=UPI003316D650